jgi:hypothetical protein
VGIIYIFFPIPFFFPDAKGVWDECSEEARNFIGASGFAHLFAMREGVDPWLLAWCIGHKHNYSVHRVLKAARLFAAGNQGPFAAIERELLEADEGLCFLL